jgi:gamma-glutamyltranspeptidase/glutathione hydrolase
MLHVDRSSSGRAEAAAKGPRGAAATVHPLATDAAIRAMRSGGNAVDAAVAAALMLGVVDSHNSGLGGGCFVLIRRADGKLVAIDGRETAPAKADRDTFVQHGRPQTELTQNGPLAVAVPGALAAYDLALEQHGRLSLKNLLLPAADIAEQGFGVDRVFAENLKEASLKIAQFPGTAAVLLKNDGSPYVDGDVVKQPDLARTYRAIAHEGPDWFYRGPFAARVGTWMAENGGLLCAEDLASYRPQVREPLITQYRDLTLVGFPPPSSGGIHVAQILNILENFDLKAIHDRDPAEFMHLLVEAMKLAFADRAHWLGDPSFARVPRGLVDKSYAARLAARIDLTKTSAVPKHDMPPEWQTNVFGKHTTHIAAADAEGNWVAITATINTAFGSKVIVPGTGIVLNNEMDDFALAPGVPNAFGLVGAEANAVAAGKRPLSSMSPTIVLREGKPLLTLGAAGGPKIISQTLLTLVRHIDLGHSLEQSVALARFHHQWSPDRLQVEAAIEDRYGDALRRLGHHLEVSQRMAVVQAVAVDSADGSLTAVHDPRAAGKSAAW